MIVVMEPGATQDQIDQVVGIVREMGCKEHIIRGTELTVVAVIGDDRKKDPAIFESVPGVQKAMKVLAPYKMAAKEVKPKRTIVKLGPNCQIGGEGPVQVIAGPCSVESEEQIVTIAKALRDAGASALRGGAFKPRTNPYAFQGHGEDGLKMLALARRESGLPIVTEVVTPSDVELVAKYADCLQVGTRNAQNFKLLEACGKVNKPVLFKRGMSMTVDEYLQAADYILAGGNPNVILCERGIRTFETHTRNTYSIATITELQHRSHLPVIGDPSHGTGHSHLVAAMTKATIACGADGAILEVAHDPKKAWSDAGQTISVTAFAELMPVLARIADAVGRSLNYHPAHV